VRSVVQTHGGHLTASARNRGGLVVRICLAAAPWPRAGAPWPGAIAPSPGAIAPSPGASAQWPAASAPRFPDSVRSSRVKSLPRSYAATLQEEPPETDLQLSCGLHQEKAGRLSNATVARPTGPRDRPGCISNR
jgi:hypothetical protein